MANILIVDDDVQILGLLEAILSSKNEVTAVTSAEEALSIFVPNKFDLIIVDIRLGGMNGLELCLRVRKQEQGLMVVALTGFYDPIFKEYDGTLAGFNRVFGKPFDYRKFVDFLKENGFL